MKGLTYILKSSVLSLLLVLAGHMAIAQISDMEQARMYVADKKYDQAIDLYEGIYKRSPDSVYGEYMNALLEAKQYKTAEKIVEQRASANPQSPFTHIDLGVVYAREGKEALSKEQFDMVIQALNGDDLFTSSVVKAFTDAGRDDQAIRAYERALELLGNPPIYNRQLAMLYAKAGNLDKAIDALLRANPGQYINTENVKTIMLELLGDDQKKLQQTQKLLVKKVNAQPDNNYYAEILTWIYTQKNDWDGALMQMEAIDERNQETGKHIFDLAREAAAAKQYETANKAYDDIIAKGKDLPYYVQSKVEKLSTAFARLKNDPDWKKEDAVALAALYDSFLLEYPKQYTQQTAADLATIQALYVGNVPRAIEVLKHAIADPDTRRNMVGAFKLQMGDYYVLIGKVWDASLTYSQVDKEFKQDVMGEDARYRNALLAYYRGDFDWAQKQLSVLKSATTELIANDALYLSVLITENVEDSDLVPLQRFAYAGLLLFQNRDKEAETLLDSLTTVYPKHSLLDDIMMKQADIAEKHHDHIKALAYLKKIYEKYGKDVLGDDAVYKTAEIYHNELHQDDQAKTFYEQLIVDHPGSTYVQAARQKLAEINGPKTP